MYGLKTTFFVSPYWPSQEKVIGVITAGGVMNISVLYQHSKISTDNVEIFKKGTIHHLEEAIRK